MSHFAEINENNEVLRVLVLDNNLPNEGYDWVVKNFGGRWIQTSYNRNFRQHFAGIGYTYNESLDAFLPPQPFASWVLNEVTFDWESPVPYPTDGFSYTWNEPELAWELADFSEPN